MPVSVRWDDTLLTTVRVMYEDRWGWPEHYAALVEAQVLMENVPHKVDLIIDVTDSLPAPPRPLWHYRQTLQMLPDNWSGSIAIVSRHRRLMQLMFYRILGSLSRPSCDWHFVSAATLSEARTALAARRTGQEVTWRLQAEA